MIQHLSYHKTDRYCVQPAPLSDILCKSISARTVNYDICDGMSSSSSLIRQHCLIPWLHMRGPLGFWSARQLPPTDFLSKNIDWLDIVFQCSGFQNCIRNRPEYFKWGKVCNIMISRKFVTLHTMKDGHFVKIYSSPKMASLNIRIARDN